MHDAEHADFATTPTCGGDRYCAPICQEEGSFDGQRVVSRDNHFWM